MASAHVHTTRGWHGPLVRLAKRFVRSESVTALLARGATGTLAIKVASAATAFGVQVLVARLLGAGSYGAYAYAITWQSFLLIFGTIGFETASLRFVAEYVGRRQWTLLRGFLRYSQRTTLQTSVLLALLACVVIWALRNRLATELTSALVIAFLILPPNALLQIRSYSVQGLKRVLAAQIPRDIVRPLFFGSGVWLAVSLGHPGTAPLAMTANLVAVLCALGITTLLLHRAMPAGCRDATPEYRHKEWLSVARVLLLVSGLNLVLARIDVLMVGSMISTRDAGIYSVSSLAASFVGFGLSSVNAIAAPLIADLHSQGHRRELQRILLLAARGVLVFSVLCTIALALGGRYALGLFGPEFTSGYYILVILAGGGLINALGGSVGFLMTMTGHQTVAAKVLLVTAVLNVVLNAVFIQLWGVTGAAIATAVATLVWNASMNYYAWKHLGVRATAI